jgi:hypothetical protein
MAKAAAFAGLVGLAAAGQKYKHNAQDVFLKTMKNKHKEDMPV